MREVLNEEVGMPSGQVCGEGKETGGSVASAKYLPTEDEVAREIHGTIKMVRDFLVVGARQAEHMNIEAICDTLGELLNKTGNLVGDICLLRGEKMNLEEAAKQKAKESPVFRQKENVARTLKSIRGTVDRLSGIIREMETITLNRLGDALQSLHTIHELLLIDVSNIEEELNP